MVDTPPCKCHGEPQHWHKDARRTRGGYWGCRTKRRESNFLYRQTDKRREGYRRWDAANREKRREFSARYSQSVKGIQRRTIRKIEYNSKVIRPQLEAQLADLQEQRRLLEQGVSK